MWLMGEELVYYMVVLGFGDVGLEVDIDILYDLIDGVVVIDVFGMLV